MIDKQVLRILDANANRVREALRVVEDVVRFSFEDGRTASALKDERHRVARSCDRILRQGLRGLKARDTASDPGRDSMSAGEAAKSSLEDLLLANFRRAEEGLRVLEETSKLVDIAAARMLKRSRFRVYDLERSCMTRMERRRAKA